MLLLGIVLIVVAAVLIGLGLFTTGNGDLDDPTATMLGLPVGSTTIFAIGLTAGVLLLLGVSLTKWGGKMQVRDLQEKRKLRKLTQTLQQTTPESKNDGGTV